MNLAVAAFNLSCAIVWLVQGEFSAAAMSVFGAWCSIKAYKLACE